MIRSRFFRFSIILGFFGAAATACGDGETNDPTNGEGGVPNGEGGGAGGPSSCPAGQDLCGDECVTLTANQNNCGSCGTPCGAGELCTAGSCVASCGQGLIACDNTCVDPLYNPNYCGATSCAGTGVGGASGEVCGERQACVIGECRAFEPTWAPGGQIDSGSFRVGTEQSIGMSASGDAVIVYRRETVAGDIAPFNSLRVFAKNYVAATKTWGPEISLDPGAARVRNLKVAVAPNGEAIAVWLDGPNDENGNGDPSDEVLTVPSQVKTASYSPTTKTWSAATRLDDHDAPSDTPDVAIDANGDALVAWSQQQEGTGELSIFVRRRSGGTFAAIEELMHQGDLGESPQVAMNDAGAMAVVFDERLLTTGVFAPRVSRHDGAAWTVPLDLRPQASIDNGNWGKMPDVGIDASGNITVVYTDDNYLTDVSVLEAVFNSASGTWGTAVPVEDLTGSALQATSPQIVVDPTGTATLVFQVASFKGDGELTDFNDVYGVRRNAAGSWSASLRLGLVTASPARSNPQVRGDGLGNAFAFWGTGTSVQSRLFVAADSDWAPLATLSAPDVNFVASPDLAVSTSGNALASWVQTKPGVPIHLFVARFD